LGLFNKNLEDKLVGMKKDEMNEISIDGSSVKVKVVNIKRKIVPDVTDEMIKKLEIEDVNTVDEFKKYAYNEKASKMKEEKFEVIYGIVLDEVIEKSKYTLENEDLEKLLEAELNKCRALSKLENLVFEEMTKEQLMTRVARESIEEFKEFLKTQNEITLKWMLVAIESARKENVVFNETTYERFIEQQAAMDKLDIQTTKELNSLLQYIPRQYSLYLKEKIRGYFETKFNCKLVN